MMQEVHRIREISPKPYLCSCVVASVYGYQRGSIRSRSWLIQGPLYPFPTFLWREISQVRSAVIFLNVHRDLRLHPPLL